eukprot:snap_masked-scaffold372_size192401-processed-gene-0.15 protein:Tk00570 transcript:snap_masked-scaffold372_size192401-processed-gene-0.15-mRNA-1 annotation:"nuclear pore complex protein nup160-like protein"
MKDFPLGLREVIPDQSVPEKVAKELMSINTGGTASTLQEIALADGSGGYTYVDDGRAWTKNRFLSWRTNQDQIELTERSLDWVLHGHRVRYRFQDTPILAGGVSIHETFNAVVILVPTVSSVHKMVFPHPNRLMKQHEHLLQNPSLDGIPSIFAEATPYVAKEHSHVIQSTGMAPMPHLAASHLTAGDEAIFVLANAMGHIQVVKLGNVKGMVTVNPLKCGSYLGRLWGNLGGMLAKPGGQEAAESVVSLAVHPLYNDVYIFGLCKDHKIRMWSSSTFDCVMVEDVLSYSAADPSQVQPGSQTHLMRKVVDVTSKRFALALFLCFSQHCQFCIIRPQMVDGQFQLDHLATVHAPELDLVDFQVSPSHLWALWTNQEGEPVLKYTTFSSSSSDKTTGWNNVVFEDELDPDFAPYGPGIDPRQAYLTQLFAPGRFSIQTLAKTVSIYRRSLDITSIPEDELTMDRLRQEIGEAVEAEIQNQVTEAEISDEEYMDVAYTAWNRFYSCAVQYHQAGVEPMGLICDPGSGLITIIKKVGISFVRPLDALEHLVLSGDSSSRGPEIFHDTPILCEDPVLAMDVIQLMRAIALVDSWIPSRFVDEFTFSLSRLGSPDQTAKRIVAAILSQAMVGEDNMDENIHAHINFTQELCTRLLQLSDAAKALEVLLAILELDRGIVAHAAQHPDMEDEESQFSKRVFASPLGTCVVAESLKQMARTRFELTRNLIVLQLLMLECGMSDTINVSTAEKIHSTFLPRSVVMAHSYHVLVWLTETLATEPPACSLERSLQQMNILRMSESAGSSSHAIADLTRIMKRPMTLSELFLRGVGGSKARRLITSDSDLSSAWYSVLMPLVNISAQLLWPRCVVPTFQEFLLSACQHMQIQEYVRLLSTWCDWHCHSRQFLLGSALLNMGEPEKAADWMVQAAEGVHSDSFLLELLFSSERDVETEKLSVLYYLKVIELFQQFGYYDFVIELAKTAIDVSDPEDPNRVKLCYTLFNHHLELGHNDEAYDSMIINPDKSRRKDSLRKFVITLFERRQLRRLASYPYIDMFEDLEYIIEDRARAVNLSDNNFYDFLYSFHVMKENYRKAAVVMYEYGMRLGTEMFNLEGLKRQAQAYLACLNCLKLVSVDNAWIVKPIPHSNRERDEFQPPGVSPKRTHEGDEIYYTSASVFKPKIDVLEISDIEREFELVCARLKLVSTHSKDPITATLPTGPGLSAQETVALLVNANLYEDAIHIGQIFDLDKSPIVKGLSSKCVNLARAKAAERDAAWEWLSDNNPCGADLRSGSAVEAAWKLLQDILSRLEDEGQSTLMKAAVQRIFSFGATLPAWLVQDYKKDAIHIGQIFDLDKSPIVKGLSSKCVNLARAKAAERDAAWEWLSDNNPCGADLRSGSAVEAAWKLLQDILSRLEDEGQSTLMKAAVQRIFSFGATLPAWLVQDYKKRNPAELVRLYHVHGYLEDAANLALEYISAVLGVGKEYFGLKESLNAHGSPVWLPYDILDQLLLELQEYSSHDPVYKKQFHDLNQKLDDYFGIVQRVNDDMIAIKRQTLPMVH